MTETKDPYGVEIDITIDFDKLPGNVGRMKDGKNLLSPGDVIPIAEHIEKIVGCGCDTLTFEGYLPPWMWLTVGAFIASNMPNCARHFKYRAQNGFTCDLDLNIEVIE